MKKNDWFILIVFLLTFIGIGTVLPTYFTILVIQLKGFISWQSFLMIGANALISYLMIDFLIELNGSK